MRGGQGSTDAIRFVKVCDIPIQADGYSLVTTSAANDGSLLLLFIEPAGRNAVHEREEHGLGSLPRPRMRDRSRFRLLTLSPPGMITTIELPELDVTFPLVDVFPDGRILVVGSRCAWRGPNDYDLNGIVFDPGSGQVSRILLGDGINRVGIDRLGRIWVAYFDEGIFGNFGWGNPGPRPIGAAGLVCFAASGEKLWELADDSMADCYALNVCGSEAFIYLYTEFPICRIAADFKQTSWTTTLRGCHELAISEAQVLLSGQYEDPPDVGYVGTLQFGELRDVRKVRLQLPDGTPLPMRRLQGRGEHMYFFNEASVYRARLD